MTGAADSDNSTFIDCSVYSASLAFNPPVQETHVFQHLLLVVICINIVECVVSSCSNFIVIYTISTTASLRRTPSNILILGLAISDLGVTLVVLPSFSIFASVSAAQHQVYCITSIISSTGIFIFFGISLYTLTAITIDRFLAVQLHLRYQELVTIKRYVLVLVGVWVCCISSPIIGLFIGKRRFFIATSVAIAVVVPLNMTLIFKIYRVIRRHSLQILAQQQSVQQSIDMPRYKKSVNTMYLVIGAFLVCYVPFAAALLLTEELDRTPEGQFLFALASSLVIFNSVLNPIIYFWRIEEIRNNAVRLLRRIWKRNEHEMEH